MAIQGKQGAIWIPVPAGNIFPGYWGHTPKWVVIHKTASGGTAQDIAHFFQTDPAKASTHYIVGQDGTIVQCVSEADGAGGNCCLEAGHATYLPTGINMNVLTISIEHVDPASDNSTPVTAAQKAASFKLVQGICQRHNIPMRAGDANGGIIGHHDISPISRRLCPNNYPMQELFDYLKGNTSMPVPQGWHETTVSGQKRLVCPNGHYAVEGILAAIENNPNYDPANMLNEEEYHVDQVQLHNLNLGPGNRQTTRDDVYWWTPGKGVIRESYRGLELKACYDLIAQQQAEIATLKTQQQATPVDNTALIAAINAIPDAIAGPVAAALVEAKKV